MDSFDIMIREESTFVADELPVETRTTGRSVTTASEAAPESVITRGHPILGSANSARYLSGEKGFFITNRSSVPFYITAAARRPRPLRPSNQSINTPSSSSVLHKIVE